MDIISRYLTQHYALAHGWLALHVITIYRHFIFCSNHRTTHPQWFCFVCEITPLPALLSQSQAQFQRHTIHGSRPPKFNSQWPLQVASTRRLVRLLVATRESTRNAHSPSIFSYHLTAQLTYHSSHVTIGIERGPTLDSSTPLATQLHFLNLFWWDETPYESLHAVVSQSCGVKPWFEAFAGAKGTGKDGDTKMG
jgi:hypothetical protein